MSCMSYFENRALIREEQQGVEAAGLALNLIVGYTGSLSTQGGFHFSVVSSVGSATLNHFESSFPWGLVKGLVRNQRVSIRITSWFGKKEGKLNKLEVKRPCILIIHGVRRVRPHRRRKVVTRRCWYLKNTLTCLFSGKRLVGGFPSFIPSHHLYLRVN